MNPRYKIRRFGEPEHQTNTKKTTMGRNVAPHLTQRQKEIVQAIAQIYADEHGFPATIREIMAMTDITSTSMIVYHLNKLERRKIIIRREGKVGVLLTAYGHTLAREIHEAKGQAS